VGAAVLLLVFAQALRPSECASREGAGRVVVWQRVKAPELGRYCDRIASGLAKLASDPGMPEEALATGVDAEKALPGRPSAMLLEGRALLRLDRAAEAYAALREARRRDDRALDEPNALERLLGGAACCGCGLRETKSRSHHGFARGDRLRRERLLRQPRDFGGARLGREGV
jgi:hypothetical protein